jgi:uncharacterized repeat protein (TIGR02543 family)
MNTVKFSLKHRLIAFAALSGVVAFACISLQSHANADNCSNAKVIFFPNGDDGKVLISGSPVEKQKILVCSGSVQVPAFTREGFNLVGWTLQPDDLIPGSPDSAEPVPGLTASSTSWSTDGSISNVFAQWQAKSYSVTYNLNGGNGTPTNTTSTFNSPIYVGATIDRTTYSFDTPTKDGFTFAGWSIGSAGTERYSPGKILSAPSSDVTFVANWAAK